MAFVLVMTLAFVSPVPQTATVRVHGYPSMEACTATGDRATQYFSITGTATASYVCRLGAK